MNRHSRWALSAALASSILVGVVSTTAGQAPAARTIWDGVYTEAQAARGEKAYKAACGYCHKDNLAGGFFYRVFDRKWYFDEFYQAVFVNGTLVLARFWSAFDAYIVDGIVNGAAALTRFASWLNGLFDAYIIDGIVNAVANFTFWVGNKVRRVQTGNINSYLYGILMAMALAIYVKVRYWS